MCMMSLVHDRKQYIDYCNSVLLHPHIIIHAATCDSCNSLCSGGPRFKCVACPDYDLCSECYACSSPSVGTSGCSGHDIATHCMLRLDIPLPVASKKEIPETSPVPVSLYPGIPDNVQWSETEKCSLCGDQCGTPAFICINCKAPSVFCLACSAATDSFHSWDHVLLACPKGFPMYDWPRVPVLYTSEAKTPDIPPTMQQRSLVGVEFGITQIFIFILAKQDPNFIVIRTMEEEDLPDVLAIECSAFEDPYGAAIIQDLLTRLF